MRLLICGGRDFTDAVWAYERLDRFHLATPVTHVIEGEADGADTIGREWAESRGIDVTPFPATQESWDRLGKVAGHMRNAQMLRERQARPCVRVARWKGHHRHGDSSKRCGRPGDVRYEDLK
jgi:YspA, cpYpsA-related SLOG family